MLLNDNHNLLTWKESYVNLDAGGDMRIIGLTGGIASGKNSVARVMESLGAVIIDADILARHAVSPGMPAYQAIVAEFGEEVLNPDRTLNRKALGRIVFADPEARLRLERITHPEIARLAEQRLNELRVRGTRVAVYMAPLLIEAGAASRVDEIWVVYLDRETQITRLMERDGICREEALLRLSAQMPMEEKIKYARVVIDNSAPPEKTEQIVRGIWEREIGEEKLG
jgi:dephospho-CoA kinase